MKNKVKNIFASVTAVVFVTAPTTVLAADKASSDTLMREDSVTDSVGQKRSVRKMMRLPRNEDCKEVEGKLVCGRQPATNKTHGFDEWHEKNPNLNENPTNEKQPI